jgi:hypothetical protein
VRLSHHNRSIFVFLLVVDNFKASIVPLAYLLASTFLKDYYYYYYYYYYFNSLFLIVFSTQTVVDTILPLTAADSNEAKLSNSSVVPDSEKDVVCVCKRRRAPRGDDRVKCKKHFTPTPTPTPTPTAIKGIRQVRV